jgi:predicted nucleic acid-binding protein
LAVFFDTNVVLYSLINDDPVKSEKAILLLNSGGIVSVQVLNEMISVLRGRKKWPWPAMRSALAATQDVLDTVDLTIEGQALATQIAEQFNLSIYDSNILASAKLAGCDVVWSEDMQHGQEIDGLRILNPFINNA